MNLPTLAKSSGFTLEEHTANVMAQGKEIIESYPFLNKKYKELTGYDLGKWLEGACKYHDAGKKHRIWQNACRADHQVFKEWQEKEGGDFKAFQRAVNNTGKNLMRANLRHEIASLIRHPNLAIQIKVAIAAHHGKLSYKHEEKWIDNPNLKGQGKPIWQELNHLAGKFILNSVGKFREALIAHYEYAGLRSLLQLADHRASIAENGAFIPDYSSFNYKFPNGWSKRPVQKLAEEYWKDKLLLMRAPTGAGKTAACLLWATKQIENNRADRLVIAMPTRFTSNALAVSVTDSLSDTGLYHSSAWFKKFEAKAKGSKKAKHEASMYHAFARRLQTPVTVCTIDHLLVSLTLSREDHHAIAFNLAHSCVVIDEADFYDDFTQANILVLLEALNELEVPVMIMSASLPESSIEMYKQTGFKVNKIIEDDSDYNRPRCTIQSIQEYRSVKDLEKLLSDCSLQPTIIYANTVDRAMEYYSWFKEKKPELNTIVYHSRFTEPHKLEKEKHLIQNLGRDAWEKETANGVAILTQIGEMSINISADVMISDVCPIDRLVQRAGRLCRFDKSKIGKLHVLKPYRISKGEKVFHPAPYGSLLKRKWVVSTALEKTIEAISLRPYSAKDFVDLINEVYASVDDFSVRAKKNAQLLKEHFTQNWIVLPKSLTGEEDSETQFWRSRDIDNQSTVLTKVPENRYFISYMEWQSFKIVHEIGLPNYLIQKGLKMGSLFELEIFIKEDSQKVVFVQPDSYDSQKGITISEPEIIL
ncbi:MAG: CRISPR-associated helicase Cas3' [Bacteroidota bacterium]